MTTGWTSISGTHLRDYAPPANFGGSNYNFPGTDSATGAEFGGLVGAWSSGVLDSTRNRLIIWGGGHNNYYGNEIYAFDLDTNVLSRLNDPGLPLNNVAYGGAAPCSGVIHDASGDQANSRHTYSSPTYMPNVDKMFVYSGSPACTEGYVQEDTWLFNFSTMAWEQKFPSGTKPNGETGGPTAAYDSATGKVFIHDKIDLFTYTAGTDAWAQLTSNSTQLALYRTAAIDPTRHKFVMIGNTESWIYDISSGSSYTKTALNTSGATTLINSGAPGLDYCSSRDRMVGWNGGDTIYLLNMDTLTWTTETYTGGPAANSDQGGPLTFGRWRYSAASNVFVVANDVDENFYTLDIGGTAPTPQALGLFLR